jgi:hypothetical protein
MPKESAPQPPKEGQSKLNNVDRGFIFMMSPEVNTKEEKTNFQYKLAKVISFFNKEINLRFEFTIKPKEK